MITKVPATTGKVLVTFYMPATIGANTFHVVGDFNNWSTTATPLQRCKEGWRVTLELDAGHAYHYRYLVDGKWFNDWNADGYEPNEHGGDNSVVNTIPFYGLLCFQDVCPRTATSPATTPVGVTPALSFVN